MSMQRGERLVPAQEVVERGLAASRTAGCIVVVEDQSQAELRFANNTVTTNGIRTDRRVTVVALSGGEGETATGVARRSGAADVAALVASAERDAAGAAPAEDEAPLITSATSSSDFDEPPARTGIGALSSTLEGLGAAFGRAASEKRLLAGFAEHEISTVYLGTSAGLRLRHEQPTGKVELVARAADGTRSAWAGTGAADLGSVRFGDLEATVSRRLAWAERRIDLAPGRYEVLLPPDAVGDLAVLLGEALSGREAEEGRSVFAAPGGGTRLGERLFDQPFGLWSDPGAPGLECSPFLIATSSGQDVSVFDEGLPLERTDWIEKGRLSRLHFHRAAALRAGVLPAPPVDNLVLEVEGATGSTDDLVARTERALLLTCLWYIREVDPTTLLLTGLTRDGVYLVEDGEVVGAVNNFRFNESPVDVLAKTVEVGKTERSLSREWNEWMNRTAMPTLRVAEFNMSSVSPAT